jgi:hypothetical protein
VVTGAGAGALPPPDELELPPDELELLPTYTTRCGAGFTFGAMTITLRTVFFTITVRGGVTADAVATFGWAAIRPSGAKTAVVPAIHAHARSTRLDSLGRRAAACPDERAASVIAVVAPV